MQKTNAELKQDRQKNMRYRKRQRHNDDVDKFADISTSVKKMQRGPESWDTQRLNKIKRLQDAIDLAEES